MTRLILAVALLAASGCRCICECIVEPSAMPLRGEVVQEADEPLLPGCEGGGCIGSKPWPYDWCNLMPDGQIICPEYGDIPRVLMFDGEVIP